MLKVLIDTGNVSRYSGIGVAAWSLLDALRRLADGDISVSEAGISDTRTGFRPVRRLAYLWRLRQLAGRSYEGADVMHFANIYVPHHRSKTAYVATIFDLDAVERPELYPKAYAAYAARSVRATLDRVDVLITGIEAVKKAVVDRYGFADDRVFVAGIGLDPDLVHSIDLSRATRDENLPLVLYVGKLERKKNLDWFVRTTAEGVKNGALPPVSIVLAGKRGFGFEAIAAAMKYAGPMVRCVHAPDVSTLASLYRRASVLVLPSLREGFGLPLLEAMYANLPIVASRIPASLEVAGDVAAFFSLGDKDGFYEALNLALTEEYAVSRSQTTVRQLQRYSWETLVPTYVDAYRRAQARK